MVSVLLGIAAAYVAPMQILFCGNSHTSVNDVPGMVRNLLEERGKPTIVTTKLGGLLLDMGKDPDVRKAAGSGKYSFVVLQGAGLSSSHKYRYSQEGGIALAKLATRAKSQVLLYAEWSRKGIAESDYILGIYDEIARAGGGKVVPICRAWDEALSMQPNLDLWADDGNHAKIGGSYIAALTIAESIAPSKRVSNWRPIGIDPRQGTLFYRAVQRVLKS